MVNTTRPIAYIGSCNTVDLSWLYDTRKEPLSKTCKRRLAERASCNCHWSSSGDVQLHQPDLCGDCDGLIAGLQHLAPASGLG